MKGWFALMKLGLFICGTVVMAVMIGGCGNKSSPNNTKNSGNFPAPTLATPPNGSTSQVTSLSLIWESVAGATAYEVRVSTVATFASVFSSQTSLTSLSSAFSGLAKSTTYYWEVNADSAGEMSGWSSAWSFTTAAPVITIAGMVSLPGGTFQMGSTNTALELGTEDDEEPIHSVTVSAFYMDSALVTQASYQSLMGVNPSYFDTGTLASRQPVESMTWFDAVLYCNARSKHDGYDTVYSYTSIGFYSGGVAGNGCDSLGNLTINYSQNGYRLPTEAEWEYACRAGTTTDYYWGQSYPPITTADTAEISVHAWWNLNSSNGTQPVATKPANAFGLYDMSGNAWEWCNDWWAQGYTSGSQTNPTGPTSGRYRVLRGGSWKSYYYGGELCAAYRENLFPNGRYISDDSNGFRCVRR